MSKKFFVSTPIFYVNDKPHIGHAYTTIIGDVLKRHYTAKGVDVFYLTGTDENAQKNVEAAEKAGESDVQAYVDRMSQKWRTTWESLDIQFDDFIRTTEDRHKKGVEQFWRAVKESGDIYKGTYEGLYCTGCEEYKAKTDLADGKCPLHNREPEVIKEENYFFRTSRYKDTLLDHIEKHPNFIQPVERRNEVIKYVQDHFDDLSISRQSQKWGIPVPDDPTQVIYVWFDALLNYMTAVGYGSDQSLFSKHWPPDLHIVGKDIIKFHCALWPAMLLSAGVELPEQVFAHGFFTIDGQKMSKSLGNVVDPVELSKKYGFDAVRYFLLREIPSGGDGDFSTARLEERYNTELGNDLGNLVSRVAKLVEDAGGQVTATPLPEYDEAVAKIHANTEGLAFDQALVNIWKIVAEANQYVDAQKPWELAKTNPEKLPEVLGRLVAVIQLLGELLTPYLPETAKKIQEQFGGERITKGEILFPRI